MNEPLQEIDGLQVLIFYRVVVGAVPALNTVDLHCHVWLFQYTLYNVGQSICNTERIGEVVVVSQNFI